MKGKHIATALILMMIVLFASSCNNAGDDNRKISEAQRSLKQIALKINGNFKELVPLIEYADKNLAKLYEKGEREKNLKKVDKSQYRLAPNGVFYRPKYGDNSAVFVSGFVPVDESIRNAVYFTEPIDRVFKEIVQSHKEIAQIYYNDKNSYNRIYPGFDVLIQYQVKMEIPSFNFYYLADQKHNPGKKAVWVNEPYVDPAGRGWMVSLIAPLYVNGKLEGVPGIDVTINDITDKYSLENLNEEVLIITRKGTVVAISDKDAHTLGLPALTNHKYIETIKSDTFLEDDFNLLKSKNEAVRRMAKDLIINNQAKTKLEADGQSYTVLHEDIPELDWMAVRIVD